MAAVPLPDGKATVAPSLYGDALQEVLQKTWHVEVPIVPWPAPPKRLVRVSAQVYDTQRRVRVSCREARVRARRGSSRYRPCGRSPGCTGASLDHHAELVGLERAPHGLFERDEPPRVEREERLVQRLHAVLVLADLHRAVDLVDLVLADQVPDGGVRDQHLDREARGPARPRRGMSCWLTTPWSTNESLARTCCCWCGGKTSMMRLMVEMALLVWSVAKTR